MLDIFACRECHAIYTICRLPQPPTAQPCCQFCGSKFPPSELGEWLAYQHAEPEWTVKAWLTGAAEENVSQPDNPSNNSDQAIELADQTAATGPKTLTTLSSGVRKFAALLASA